MGTAWREWWGCAGEGRPRASRRLERSTANASGHAAPSCSGTVAVASGPLVLRPTTRSVTTADPPLGTGSGADACSTPCITSPDAETVGELISPAADAAAAGESTRPASAARRESGGCGVPTRLAGGARVGLCAIFSNIFENIEGLGPSALSYSRIFSRI